jgi:glutaredoxin 3
MSHKKIVVYIKESCPYCTRALALLKNKELDFESISVVGKDQLYEELKSKTGHQTVPQIFIGETFIGGYKELSAFEATGELDRMLNT